MENEKQPFERSFDSLEELADAISDTLRCSVTIEDANHKLIAYSFHHDQADPARISTIIGKRVPEKVVQALWRDGVIPQLIKTEGPVVVKAIEEIGLGDRVAIAIRKDHNILGYIWIVPVESELSQEYVFAQLAFAAQAARTKLLQLQMTRRKTEQGYREFFRQLLSGEMKPDAEVKRQADRLGLELPAYYCVNVLPFPTGLAEKQQQQIQYLITTTLQKKIALHAVNDSQLILLETLPSGQPPGPVSPALTLLGEQMASRFDCAPDLGGCGSVYGDYSRVHESYRDAMTVIRLRNAFPDELASVHYYADLGYYRLLPALLRNRQEHDYRNECLRKLENYDLEHKSDLLNTLEVYLCHDSNMKESADALHIHENTLSYRLKRISQIGGIDLNRMDEKVTCFLELKANRFR